MRRLAPRSWLHARPTRLGPAGRVWIFTAALAVCLVAGALTLRGYPVPPAPVRVPGWALVLVFLAAGNARIRIWTRSGRQTLNMNEAALVLGAFCTGPLGTLLAMTVANALTEWFRAGRDPMRTAFNVASEGLAAAIGLLLFAAVDDPGDLVSPRNWLAAVALVAPMMLTAVTTLTAMTLHTGRRPHLVAARTVAALSLVNFSLGGSIGLVTVTLVEVRPAALVLLVVPGLFLAGAFRLYTRAVEERKGSEFLRTVAVRLLGARDAIEVLGEVLQQAQETFGADTVELLMREGDSVRRLARHEHGPAITPMPGDHAEAFALADPAALVVTHAVAETGLRSLFLDRGFVTGMVAPLRVNGQPWGTLLMGRTALDGREPRPGALAVFETLAALVATGVEQSRLGESLAEATRRAGELEDQAFRDPLTGLPNRTLLDDRLEHALLRSDRGSLPVSVLFIDLDGFKAVNDTAGHAAGDALLVRVAMRLSGCIRGEDTVARLGGDEFAVVLEDVQSAATAELVAERVRAAVQRESAVGRPISASIGIASAISAEIPDHRELLRRADAAMYSAKRGGKDRAVRWTAEAEQRREVSA